MSTIKSATDIYLTYRFIRALVTPFNKTKAFELGIIDADGNPLKKKRDLKTTEEKTAYTIYDRLVFKLKRLLGKIPGGKTRLASFAAALWLIKEQVCQNEEQAYVIEEEVMKHLKLEQSDFDALMESAPAELATGRYVITENVSVVFEDVSEGDVVTLESSQPTDYILGVALFKVVHENTKQELVVSHEEIQPIYI
jgi:hypothetical protein